MPVCTEQGRGFSVSKWELNYLKRRYWSHRNKVEAATSIIDTLPPARRPHVEVKLKKALKERDRQLYIMSENIRVLNKMADTMDETCKHYGTHKKRMFKAHPILEVTRRNCHILFQWFFLKFRKYFPWWGEIDY